MAKCNISLLTARATQKSDIGRHNRPTPQPQSDYTITVRQQEDRQRGPKSGSDSGVRQRSPTAGSDNRGVRQHHSNQPGGASAAGSDSRGPAAGVRKVRQLRSPVTPPEAPSPLPPLVCHRRLHAVLRTSKRTSENVSKG